MKKSHVLIVEDQPSHRQLIAGVLKSFDVSVEKVFNPIDEGNQHIELEWVIDSIEKNHPDLLILDMAWTPADGEVLDNLLKAADIFQFWNSIKKQNKVPQVFKLLEYLGRDPSILIIILTDYSMQVKKIFHEVINTRADRIILKKPDANASDYERDLKPNVAKCLNAIKFLKLSKSEIYPESASTIDLFNTAMEVANTDATILITGETGIGKTFLARAIHTLSLRTNGPFVERNIASIPHELFYSTLFGHEKGAFTGAVKYKPGIIEKGNGGTVFLDEIGDLPLEEQVVLLKAIEEKHVYPLGGEDSDPVKVDSRYILATNKDIEELIRAHLFREDLYHRINVIQLRLPPLRERKGDIAAFIDFFLKMFSEELNRPAIKITEAELSKVLKFEFPGNIRQLRSIVYRAMLLNISILDSLKMEKDIKNTEVKENDKTLGHYLKEIIAEKKTLNDVLGEIEAAIFKTVINLSSTNKEAADTLGLTLSTFEVKKRKLTIIRSDEYE